MNNFSPNNINILFRGSLAEDGEETAIRATWGDANIYTSRARLPHQSRVVGRYSVLPYYKELEDDLAYNGSLLVNSFAQHVWIASFAYYYDIEKYTFPSWFAHEYPYVNYDGPVVIKGATNSMKLRWNTHMFAPSREDVSAITSRLFENDMISHQGLIYRQYIPLEKVSDVGLNGLPLTKEYRLFFYKTHFCGGGFYWSGMCDTAVVNKHARIPDAALELGTTVAKIAANHVNFFVIDVARTERGEWICVEINDGQMSGLSNTNPHELYTNLRYHLHNEK